MADVSEPSDERDTPAQRAIRVQILATEHWGLLAARSTAQSEVLTRITIFLTLVSAGLVTIGLLGQATGFSGWFATAALSILGFLFLVGLMTQMRVINVAEEDMMYVIAMNRLRAAYVGVDPTVEPYFMASAHDDEAGMMRTYSFLRPRGFSQAFGSSALLISVVEGCVLGLFTGGLIVTLGGAVPWAVVTGVLLGLAVVWLSGWYSIRGYAIGVRNLSPINPSDDSGYSPLRKWSGR